MMIRAVILGAAHGSARGFAWGSVVVAAVTVVLQFLFFGC